jgi:hypothetical protein
MLGNGMRWPRAGVGLLELARFLIVVGGSYAKPAAIVAVANIGAVVAVRALLPTFHIRLLTRGGGFVSISAFSGLQRMPSSQTLAPCS